jgi:ATP-dependent exoDNAse (exonuclease V) beta subunit
LKDTIAEEILRRYVPNVNFDLIDDVEQSLTPLELLEKAIVAYGVEDHVRKGTDGEYGIATLEALRDLCREYMSDCALRDVPATQADFIRYFSESEKAGASATGGDCIQVITYHKAKGLEWPIVILGSLGKELKGSPFGVRVFQDGEFNAANPLANRILQYVPAPFGARRKDESGHFENCGIDEFDRQHKEVMLSAKEESKRLMYVGVTRAKDEVIFLAKKKTTKEDSCGEPQISWLEAISDTSLFRDNFMKEGAAKWKIGDSQKEFDVEMELLPDQDGGEVEMPSAAGWRDAVVEKPVNYLNSKISPSSMEGKDAGAAIGEKVEIGAGIGVTVFSNPEELGNCVHSYLAVAEIEKDECQQLAEKVVRQWGVESVMAFDKLVRAGEQLRTFIDERWAGAKIHTEVPMSFELSTGQVSEGFIDMLVETKDGYVIIDHKMVRPFEEEKLKVTYGAQLQCYRNAVEKATGKKVLQTFLHLPNQGVCMELKNYHPIAKDI